MFGLRPGILALILFVWIIGASLGSTFEYQNTATAAGLAYATGNATFTNGSATVTGAGTAWVVAMQNGNTKYNADNVNCKIKTVVNPTTITLYDVYPAAGGTGAYTINESAGWAGTGTGGYPSGPVDTLGYLMDIRNAGYRNPLLGDVTLPLPNPKYFEAIFNVMTLNFSFLKDDYPMVYWIFIAPFAMMGILSLVLLTYGLIRGNITWG